MTQTGDKSQAGLDRYKRSGLNTNIVHVSEFRSKPDTPKVLYLNVINEVCYCAVFMLSRVDK